VIKKGVSVNIIIPERTDKFFINIANYIFASLVYKPCINFYFSKNFIHAKALLIDNKEGLIGSQNIDAFSFDHNVESGVIFQRQDMVKKLKTVLKEWKSNSHLLVFDVNKKWYQRLLETIFQLLQPVL
jgi:cardiolipin synthase